ncbi:MAG: hypothetical protein ACTSPB_02435 [Candidatus Thorarchaeota archaeon]
MVGYNKPKNKILVAGVPLIQELKIKTIDNCYPGRLVTRDTTDAEIKVAGTAEATAGGALGFLGYEQAAEYWKPETVDTIYKVDKDSKLPFVPVLSGDIVVVASLASGQNVTKGAILTCAADGELTAATIATDMLIAIAEESVDASGGAKDIMVRSLI